MNFKKWLISEESIEQNFDQWIEDVKKYAQPNESELKNIIVSETQKQLIINALKKEQKENQDYLKYLLGFIKSKPNALSEDFDRTLDAIKWAITNNKITKQQIANEGWYNTGKKSSDIIRMKEDSAVSNRQIKREKKLGISSDLKPKFVSGNFKIYFIPKVRDQKVNDDDDDESLKSKDANDRHKLLCKYGKDTEWCTASPTGTYHAIYAHRDIYVVHENDKPIFQFTGCTEQDNDSLCQFMDVNDNEPELIPLELIELIMEKLPDIAEFYKFTAKGDFVLKSFAYSFSKSISSDQIESLLEKKLIKDMIINAHVSSLLHYTYDTDKDRMAEIIISKKPKLYSDDVSALLRNATDKEETAELIIKKQDFSDSDVYSLLRDAIDKDGIAELIIKYKKELTNSNVGNLLDKATNKDGIAELIINKKPELTDSNVVNLLANATDIDRIAELLQKKTDNISKLSDQNVKFMFGWLVFDKPKMAQIINKYHQKKTPEIQKLLDKYL